MRTLRISLFVVAVIFALELIALAIRPWAESQPVKPPPSYPAKAIDRHGFANPDTIWDGPADIILLGDSLMLGGGVRPDDSPAEILRSDHPHLLNLAVGGTGPLTALSNLEKFGPLFRPPTVVLAINDTDFSDVQIESGSPVTPAEPLAFYTPIGRGGFLADVLFLRDLRHILGSKGPASPSCFVPQAHDVRPVSDAVQKIRGLTESWGGKLIVVYLPLSVRYRDQEACDYGRRAILATVPNVLDVMSAMTVKAMPLSTGNYFAAPTYHEFARIMNAAIK